MPRLYAGGVQFDTTLREKCFPRRTRRRRKPLNLFFAWLKMLCEAFMTGSNKAAGPSSGCFICYERGENEKLLLASIR